MHSNGIDQWHISIILLHYFAYHGVAYEAQTKLANNIHICLSVGLHVLEAAKKPASLYTSCVVLCLV